MLGLTTRKLQVTPSGGGEALQVTQLHFKGWPDHGVPESPDALLRLRAVMDKRRQASKDHKAPVLVHCSAGVGRTGTLIGLDNIARQLEERPQLQTIDVLNCAFKMRQDRCLMVT